MDKMFREVYYPPLYKKDEKCNGCGSGWNAHLVPNTIYFLSIKEACCIHDYMYSVGITQRAKQAADIIFLENMLAIIESYDKWYYPTALARRRALKYYEAVVTFGNDAFWKGK